MGASPGIGQPEKPLDQVPMRKVGALRLERTRVAIVGCGAVSRRYHGPALQALAQHGWVEVAALYDPDSVQRAELEHLFPDARRIGNLNELASANVDLAIVASPPRYHAEQTVRLLRAGLSVLCEKPMATSMDEAEEMVATAATSAGVLAVGLYRRFFPAVQTIRHMVSRGTIGQLRGFTFSEGAPFRWPIHSASYFKAEPGNGGVFLDIGPHVLDQASWWFGELEVIGYEDDALGGIEVNCRVACRTRGGVTGEIRLSRDIDLGDRYVIQGDKGWLAWRVSEPHRVEMGFHDAGFAFDARVHTLAPGPVVPDLGPPAGRYQQSFIAQIANVVRAMQKSEPLLVSGEEGMRTVSLIAAGYRQRTLMSMPWLGDDEVARARRLNDLAQTGESRRREAPGGAEG